jgi:hypothetical protein
MTVNYRNNHSLNIPVVCDICKMATDVSEKLAAAIFRVVPEQ